MTALEIMARVQTKMEAAASPYSHRTSSLLAVLHAVQDELGFIPAEAEQLVADFLQLSPNHVREALSFYTLFRRVPPARYRLQICRTLSCELGGNAALRETVRRKLGLADGGRTPDGMFSLEPVECLGACELAPAIRVNDGPAQGPMDAESMEALLDRLRAEGGRR